MYLNVALCWGGTVLGRHSVWAALCKFLLYYIPVGVNGLSYKQP